MRLDLYSPDIGQDSSGQWWVRRGSQWRKSKPPVRLAQQMREELLEELKREQRAIRNLQAAIQGAKEKPRAKAGA